MKNVKILIAVVLALVLSLTCLAGCYQPEAGAAVEIAPGGVLCLKVNPEIAVSYDAEGKVTAVTARNEDAKKILENYKGFQGKEAKVVVVELVDLIGNAGYFVEEVEGEARQITLEIEPGSSLPNGTFLNDVIAQVKETVNSNNWSVPLDVKGESEFGITDYVDTDYGVDNDGVTDFGKTDYDATDYGKTDYDATDYGASAQATEPAAEPAAAAKDDSAAAASKESGNKTANGNTDYTDYGKTDYNDKNTDYGKTDYDATDYGKTDYDATDYGKTDYDATDYGTSNQKPAESAATEPAASGSSNNTDYNDPTDYGNTDYNDKATDYNEPVTDYGKTDYDATDYGTAN